MPTPVIIGNATLYTFSTFRLGKLVKVVRITDSASDDWLEWPKRYRRQNALITECPVVEFPLPG